jgi:DNA-binding transcriptional MocR family regulator
MTADRAHELAQVLHRDAHAHARAHRQRAIVIEDDHSGDIAAAADVSLARDLPERVLHIRSFSKSHGPDLRIAALGGPAALMDRIVARRMLGPGWTSRMLQQVLLELLTGANGMTAVTDARRVYHSRQVALARALTEHGVPTRPGDGINLWVAVASERAAVVHLAAAGVRVAAGGPFRSGTGGEDHVRVTVGQVRSDVDEVAAVLADAARAR